MSPRFARPLLAALIALALVLPQVSAALSGLGVGGGRVIVLCTGDGLRTIRLDAEGAPVSLSESVDPCGLLHAVGDVPALTGVPFTEVELPLRQCLSPDPPPELGRAYPPGLPRAPPRCRAGTGVSLQTA